MKTQYIPTIKFSWLSKIKFNMLGSQIGEGGIGIHLKYLEVSLDDTVYHRILQMVLDTGKELFM